jgi:hypothetical protein
VAINRNGEEMQQSTDNGRKPTTLDAAQERGIRQPAFPAMATETDGKHWVAGGVTSGGGGNGICCGFRYSATAMGECIFSDYSKLAQKLL